MVHGHLPSEVLHAEVSDQRVFAGSGKPTQAATELLGAQVDAEVPGEGVWVRGDERTLLALVDIIVIMATTAATSAGGGAVCDGGNQGERRRGWWWDGRGQAPWGAARNRKWD